MEKTEKKKKEMGDFREAKKREKSLIAKEGRKR